MSKPILTMKVEVLDMRAVNDFICKIDPAQLNDDDLLDFAGILDKKKAELSMELIGRGRRNMGDKKLTEDQKAKILLKNLDEYLQVNWNFEEYYLKALKSGLKEIEEKESKKAD